ncbi:MAG: AraC family transcriptional regulator [Bacillota bacterium]
MVLNDTATHILNRLVGLMDMNTAANIMKAIDCFLHPKVSLFIPSNGQCEYAATPNHAHPAFSFIYYFQPIYDFVIEGKNIAYDLAEGKCLSAISPNIPHQEIVQDHFQSYIAILIDQELFQKTILQYVQPVPVFRGEAFSPHPELLGVLRCFMLESSSGANANLELLDHLAQVITHLTIRSVLSDIHHTVPLYDRFEVDQAIAYMNSHFSEKITINDLAKQAARSSGHFSKVFKSVTGMTPMDYLSMIRIQKARNLLINTMNSMTEIALECGFNTSSYFSSCFLEKYKTTPSAFRQNFKQKS